NTRMSSTWSIHYDRWIIDDGEPQRDSDEHFQWSLLSFYSLERLTQAAAPARSGIEVDDYNYEIVAEIVHLSSSAVVIDFGLNAFGERDSAPSGCQVGDYIAGRIRLSLLHYCHPSLPSQILESMNRNWFVEGIWADLTPYRRVDEAGRTFVRDSRNATYERVKSTREKKARSYVLQCTLLPG
ncbi:MAG TPA: hypothetical protein VG096_27110, partial [Bryobacteraceae bacterium]|nr:hypothetical protein [Bryobacteraceae bacterium]